MKRETEHLVIPEAEATLPRKTAASTRTRHEPDLGLGRLHPEPSALKPKPETLNPTTHTANPAPHPLGFRMRAAVVGSCVLVRRQILRVDW